MTEKKLTKQVVLDDGTEVEYDIAFGGAFYAYCNVNQLNLNLDSRDYRKIIDYGCQIKKKVMNSVSIKHPIEPDLGFLYGVIFVGESTIKDRKDDVLYMRNVCVFADGEGKITKREG